MTLPFTPRMPVWRLLVATLLVVFPAIVCTGCVRVRVHDNPQAPLPGAAQHVEDRMHEDTTAASRPLRIATYNASLYDESDGGLIRRLEADDPAARKIAAVLQRVRPDVVLLNEFDYDAAGRAADLFQQHYLERPQVSGGAALRYPYRYLAPVNNGVRSGLDIDGNGHIDETGRAYGNDAWSYGLFPGQYAMMVLSRYPLDTDRVRTFRHLKWSAMPNAARPLRPGTQTAFHPDAVWCQLRLSSKSHWDIPVRTPHGLLHFLVSHPTPPVFDGPEDRNGARNADELRLWQEYLDNDSGDRSWLCDDSGSCGGLPAGEYFVLAGDYNNDPLDGDGRHDAIISLLDHPRLHRYPPPRSDGAVAASEAAPMPNAEHRGPHAEDTGSFGGKVGNLRLDYLLPSEELGIVGSGVYWPMPGTPEHATAAASDHYAVWVDLIFMKQDPSARR